MPKLTPEQVKTANTQADIVALIRSRGVMLHKQGATALFKGNCPFHPSEGLPLSVYPNEHRYTCATCGATGDALGFLQAFDGISKRHAYELLQSGQAAYRPVTETPCRKSIVSRLALPLSPDTPAGEILNKVVRYYHTRLLASPPALAFLAALGLDDTTSLQQLQLGFSDRTLGLHLPHRRRGDGAILRKRLEEAGIIRASGHERLNGSIVVPTLVRDDAGWRVAALHGHKIARKLNAGSARDLHVDGDGDGIWNLEGLTGRETAGGNARDGIILCNAALDALVFWANGFRNVTFNHRGEGLTGEMLAYLGPGCRGKSAEPAQGRVRRLYLAYRNSEPDEAFAQRDGARLHAIGMDVYQCKWARDMPLHQHLGHKQGNTVLDLQAILDQARWVDPCLPASGALVPAAIHRPSAVPGPVASDTPPAGLHPPVARFLPQDNGFLFAIGTRQYHIAALKAGQTPGMLKTTLMLKCAADLHLDHLDLARDSERRRFADRAAEETGITARQIRRDLGKLLLELEQHLQKQTPACTAQEPQAATRQRIIPDLQHTEALALLQNPDLLAIISDACETCGLVGEHTNRLAAYLACTSRILDRPLAIIIQSSSAAGKSTLMETILRMMPEEDCIQYSAMTGQSLFYLGKTDLQHKILAIAEEQGVRKASYPLKLLQSEGRVTIATTGKNQSTGRIQTQEYIVTGPVMIFLTTTAPEIDRELLGRCLVLAADESPEQTARIHARQRSERTLQGIHGSQQRDRLLSLLRNAQRLLKPLPVVNPWADQLTFDNTSLSSRRDHQKYLTLIDTIALLHQYQRGRSQMPEDGGQRPEDGAQKSDLGSYITVTLDDIALANRLLPALLGHADASLPPQTRQVLDTIRRYIQPSPAATKETLFSRRQIRDLLGWSTTQTRMHLERLRARGLIQVHQTQPGQPVQYRLRHDKPADRNPFGLADPATLRPSAGAPSGCRGVSELTPTPLNHTPLGT